MLNNGKRKMTINVLLNAIGEAEGARPDYWKGNPYDLTLGKGKYSPASGPISEMLVKNVKNLQKQMVKNGAPSGAVGKYQFINKTLLELQKALKFKDTDVFSPELQDKMANKLLERRGLKKFLKGEIHIKNFMKNLSKEWASLPNPETGVSYYGQRTHFSVNDMYKILSETL